MTSAACIPAVSTPLVPHLRTLAVRSLARMYLPEAGVFAFRLRRTAAGIVTEGRSLRYTAVALIGLSTEEPIAADIALAGQTPHAVCDGLLRELPSMRNLGDVALTCWAAGALRHPEAHRAAEALRRLAPERGAHPTVELAWALSAAALDPEARLLELAHGLADRLIASLTEGCAVFPHVIGGDATLRAHVSCFADLVYPIQALSHLARVTGRADALQAANRCAAHTCARQGASGQWWWQYDRRTGAVIERFPVYAVHQDAMAPMALFALADAGGDDHADAIRRGLRWLACSPELDGGSLLDDRADILWRKVGRREPGKLSRYLQAGASRLHTRLRFPGLDQLLPPGAIDFEDRPYHLGWLLHAWPPARAAAMEITS